MPKVVNRVRLTKRVADAAKPGTCDRLLWDTELPGFGLRTKPTGLKSYVLQYRNKRGRSRRVTLGKHGPLTADKARDEARKLRGEVALGGDPASERTAQKQAETMVAFCERYLKQHAEAFKKERSVAGDRALIRRHIVPAFGRRQVAEITRADVTELHQSLSGTPFLANRVLALISKMMNLAERWGVRPDGTNPCRHVQRFKEGRRQRFLSSAELLELGKVLTAVERENVEQASVVPAIRLALLTGARRSEVLGLRWEHVDWEHQALNLPDSKTGAKTIHLSAPALRVLQELSKARKNDSPWVLAGRLNGRPLVGLPHAWQRIRKRAKLGDLRLHDLRHSYASVAAASHMSLPVIGALLGHSQPQTTQRYAHLAADPLKEATALVGERIAALMTPKTKRAANPVNVIPLRKQQRRR